MAKGDAIKSLLALIGIIVFAVLIVNVGKIIPQKQIGAVEGNVDLESNQNLRSDQDVSKYGECFSESSSTVVFVHSNYCPHCKTMFPIVEEVEKEGYKFFWAEGSDVEARQVIDDCFSDLLSGYVPQFICPKTGIEQTGGMSKEDLKKFAEDCS